MVPADEAAARIQQIDALQDEVLRKLDELERRTERVLAEHLGIDPRSPDAPLPAAAEPDAAPSREAA